MAAGLACPDGLPSSASVRALAWPPALAGPGGVAGDGMARGVSGCGCPGAEVADRGTLRGFPCPPAMVRGEQRGRAERGAAGWAVRPEAPQGELAGSPRENNCGWTFWTWDRAMPRWSRRRLARRCSSTAAWRKLGRPCSRFWVGAGSGPWIWCFSPTAMRITWVACARSLPNTVRACSWMRPIHTRSRNTSDCWACSTSSTCRFVRRRAGAPSTWARARG